VSESSPSVDNTAPRREEVQPPARGAADQPVRPDPYEGAVPPGYDWPTHGGYLGCLLGLMASCLLAAFLGSTLYASLSCSSPIPGQTLTGCRPMVPSTVAALLTVLTLVVAVVGLGRLGWVLGRRFYREYAQRPTWGESDTYLPEGGGPGAPMVSASDAVSTEQDAASTGEQQPDARTTDELRT
jgi:hypothetical protein